jgi:uncharacterized protein YcbK (DUF882 family)
MKQVLTDPSGSPLSRRSFLGRLGLLTAGTGLLASLPGRVLAAGDPPARLHWVGEARDIMLYNSNTRERIQTVFYAHGEYNKRSFNQLCHFLRDHHENATHWMDPRLLTLLHDMQCVFDKREIQIISGYRTARTNAWLRKRVAGVAKDSYHMKGQAVDIRVPGVDTRAIRDVAKVLAMGGVGYYPRSRFVHVDTGPIRTW